MEKSKVLDLLHELIRVSREDKVVWRSTAKPNEFMSAFRGRFSILIGMDAGSVYFRVKNLDGQELVSLSSPTPDQPFAKTEGERDGQANALMLDLYRLVRRGGLQADESIDEILQELKRR